MTAAPSRTARSVLMVSGAATAFAVGSVACLELLSLALPGPRGAFRTWGPVMTVLAGSVIVVAGFPLSLLVEAASRRMGSRPAVVLGGYVAGALAAVTVLWAVWRAFVDATATPAELAREFLVLGVGALAIWAGARLAERGFAVPLFVFGTAGLAAVTLAAALMRA